VQRYEKKLIFANNSLKFCNHAACLTNGIIICGTFGQNFGERCRNYLQISEKCSNFAQDNKKLIAGIGSFALRKS